MLERIEPTEDIIKLLCDELERKTTDFRYVRRETYEDVLRNDAILLKCSKAYYAVEIIKYDTGIKVMYIAGAKYVKGGDDIEQIQDAMKVLEKLAKDLGVDEIHPRGRLGWRKVLPDYKVKELILYKEI